MQLPWLNSAEQHLFGRHISNEVHPLLQQATYSAELDPSAAEQKLWSIWRLYPDQPALLIVLYKFYLHHARLAEALQTIRQAILAAAEAGGLPTDWKSAKPDSVAGRAGQTSHELYLFCLREMSTLLLRMGSAEEGYRVLEKLYELDPGGSMEIEMMRGLSRSELTR